MKRLAMTVLMTAFSMGIAHAEVCKVTDPTGTPLNVRNNVHGKVLGTLKNNTVVSVSGYDTDRNGRAWAYVHWQGQPLKNVKQQGLRHEGWVYREYISCYR